MADYYVDIDGNVTSKKKKKKKQEASYTVSLDGTVIKNDDIAPVSITNGVSASGVKNALEIANEKAIYNPQNGFDWLPMRELIPQEKEKWYQGWLKKSEGNVGQAIESSAVDLGADATTGIVGMGEKAIDFFATIAPYLLYGDGTSFVTPKQRERAESLSKDAKVKTSEFVKKDLINEEEFVAKYIVNPHEKMRGIDVEKMSVFDHKSDALAQSAGQMLATHGLQYATGLPWFITTGITSFGAESENALKEGATYDEAALSATISAGADVLTEMISGGISFGGKTLDSALTKQLATGISNKYLRTLAKYGIDIAGEGLEEWLAEDLSNFGRWITYQDEKTFEEMFLSEEAMQAKIEAFIGGGILGGSSSVSNSVKSKVSGKDFVTGYTQSEQMVIDKIFEDTVKDDNKKLSKKDKSKLYEEISENLKNGYIDTDTIGSIFAEDTHKKYTEAVEKEKADLEEPNKELEQLESKLKYLEERKAEGEAKTSQTDAALNHLINTTKNHIEETQNRIDEIKKNSGRLQLQQQMDSEVYNLVKGTKLAESYAEKARRGQFFEEDLDSYTDENEKKSVENFMDYAKANEINNGKVVHDFVDLITKLARDRKRVFKFMTTEQIKESIEKGNPYGITRKAEEIEAFVTGNEVIINMDANKALPSLVGHEITHTLEGSKAEYKKFQDALFKLAKTRGEYDSRWESIQRRYKDSSKEEQLQELASDLVGDYIFGDTNFVQNLATENPNIFQKIYNEIKYLLKLATAGSKEQRQLEIAKKKFEDAWRKAHNTESISDGDVSTKLSVGDSDGNGAKFNGKPFWSGSVSLLDGVIEEVHSYKEAESADFHHSLYFSPGQVEKLDDGTNGFFWVEDGEVNGEWRDNLSEDIIKKIEEQIVKFSIADSEGKQLTKEQQTYFKDSKMRDEKGDLKVMYHGTGEGGFHTFDSELTNNGAFFFSDSNTVAKTYSGTDYQYSAKTLKTVDDINKIIKEDNPSYEYEAREENGKYVLYEEGDVVAESDSVKGLYYEYMDRSGEGYGSKNYKVYLNITNPLVVDAQNNNWDELPENENNLTSTNQYAEFAKKNGYDGVIINNVVDNGLYASGYERFAPSTVAIAFNSNQIKSVDNVNPTSNADIRYTISTEYDSLPKPKPSLDPTAALLQKDTRSVRDIRNETMVKNGFTAEEVGKMNEFFDEMGEFMKTAGMTYKYIGLEDVNNAKLKITYDNDGNPQKIVLSAMVKNGDYPVNFDFTSICKKRQSISLVVKELAKRQTDGKRTLDVVNMSAESLWKINEELRKAGLETACLGCFVESKRYNIQNFSTKATNMWNRIVNEVRREQGIEGNVEYFNFAEGIDLDSVDYIEVDKIFKDYATQPNRTSPENRMRALIRSGGAMYQKYLQPSDLMTPEGIEAIKSMSSKKNNFYGILQGVYGQASPKEVMGFSPYNSEIALLPEKKGRQMMSEYIKSIGGVRMQSFSDFLVANVYDYMQMVGDLAARKLPAHAYTKEIAFAKIFGMTGIKVNMSVMFDIDSNLPDEYAGLTFVEDENGDEEYNGIRGRFEYLVADQKRSDAEFEKTKNRPYVQSIPFDEAVALQRDARYSKNVGIIGVGYSDYHILKMLGDDDIRYVIPYHASSLPAIIKDATKIRKATDYTDFQTVRNLKSITDGNGNAVDFKEFRKQFGTLAEAYSKLSELVKDEGWKVGYGGKAKIKFNLYKDLEKTKDPRKTVANYLEWCSKNNLVPVFSQFAGHENYYKLIYDFDVYDSVTGEYSPQTAVSNIYDGYNASEGEFSTESIKDLVDGEMFIQNEKNRVRNEKIPSVVDSVLEQLGMKEDGNEDVKHRLADDDSYTSKAYGRQYTGSDLKLEAPVADETIYEETIDEDIAPESIVKNPRTERIASYSPLTEEEANARDAERNEQDFGPVKPRVAKALTESTKPKKKSRFWSQAMELIGDKGFVFENLAKKTKNRELEAKWNSTRYAEGKAQEFIGNGTENVRAINDINAEVQEAGISQELYDYAYHLLNIDRMTLSDRFGTENKPVYGETVTAEESRRRVKELEASHPELKSYINELYNINNHLRELLVDGGIITRETANLWEKMYPHYVPIDRAGMEGGMLKEMSIEGIMSETEGTGVNAPVKRATGGNSDMSPLLNTMATRAIQTYKAIARNNFGVELKNTLKSVASQENADVDGIDVSIDQQEDLLQKGKHGKNPTFTVFENGKKVTFEITENMYDALSGTSEFLSHTIKPLNAISQAHRGVLTQYNPAFMARNFAKDAQDVLINSQHPGKTYANFPKSVKELLTKGEWYNEYVANGGDHNTYFQRDASQFKKDKSAFIKLIGSPFNAISQANEFIEKIPRLAEYIASRESGASVDVAMLDAARVTTNFAAGGDLTKFANRNGATFLNATVQGAMQQVRNVREAKMNGLKGWTALATKYALAGIPMVLLNKILWDDDEEYEDLSDYVKENYYIVAKFGDGEFVRIPKGRMVSVLQNAFEQTMNALTGDDEVDLQSFLQLVVTNLAPNNPIEDNIIAPIAQARANKTWYGEELVPTRLQDLPNEEQFDETTDSLSKWLGENTGQSPYKINYLLEQYTGGFGDVVLPMMTTAAETSDDSFGGKLLAPLRDSFATDSVLKNQNVADFYEKSDELKINANSSKATDEDILSNKYVNSISGEMSDLYKEKREIQNSDMTDSEKYYLVRETQKKINALAESALNEYGNVKVYGNHASVGDKQYRLTEEGWTKLTSDQIKKQDEVTNGLGISKGEYWSNKEEYDMMYKNPEKYKVLQEQGISVKEYNEDYKETALIYTDDFDWAANNPGKYAISKAISDDVLEYREYTNALNAIKGEKDSSGKTISGSKKKNQAEYINNLNLDYGQKIILYRSLFDSAADRKMYDNDIKKYIDGRKDLSYQDKVTILETLGISY